MERKEVEKGSIAETWREKTDGLAVLTATSVSGCTRTVVESLGNHLVAWEPCRCLKRKG